MTSSQPAKCKFGFTELTSSHLLGFRLFCSLLGPLLLKISHPNLASTHRHCRHGLVPVGSFLPLHASSVSNASTASAARLTSAFLAALRPGVAPGLVRAGLAPAGRHHPRVSEPGSSK
eukprot:757757-Hanusia_phi.AAC.2